MAMVQLQQQGLLKQLVTLNLDGLHSKSGIDPAILTELFGNTNVELCSSCSRKYLREFGVRTAKQALKEHRTGRICYQRRCRGAPLIDSIVSPGENMHPTVEAKGKELSG